MFSKNSSKGYLIYRKILNEYEIIAISTNIKYLRKGVGQSCCVAYLKRQKVTL